MQVRGEQKRAFGVPLPLCGPVHAETNRVAACCAQRAVRIVDPGHATEEVLLPAISFYGGGTFPQMPGKFVPSKAASENKRTSADPPGSRDESKAAAIIEVPAFRATVA